MWHQPFYVMVVIKSGMLISLTKNMKVVAPKNTASKMVPVREEVPFDLVIAVPIYKNDHNMEQQFTRRQQVTKTYKEIQEDDQKNRLNLN